MRFVMGEIKKFGPLGKEVREARMSEKKKFVNHLHVAYRFFSW